MVKTPKTRHSKVHRDPVTIDLGPGEVSRIDEPKAAAEEAAIGEPVASAETPAADAAAPEQPTREAPAEEPGGDKSLDDELAAKIGSESPYASAFGRSAGDEQADSESDAPGGAARGLLAGLVGGVIALLGAGALQYAGLLPAPGNAETSSLRTEIGVLRQEIDGLKDSAGLADADALRKVLSESNARVDGLATSLDKVESDLAGLRAAPSDSGGGGPAVQALDQKIKELESALAGLQSAGGSQALDALNDKVASVENAMGVVKTASDTANASVAALEEKLAGISEKVEEQAGQPRVALAIAASGLKAAVDRGGPFSTELETFGAIAPNAPELPELRPLAERGVPSRADLVAATPDAANAMIAASQVIDENAGIVDRLVASAKSLVKVRPTGAVEGEGVPEKVARLEAAVKEGDLAKALAEYDSLPEPSRAAGAGFADSLRGRLKVEQLVDKALAGALKPA
jgi:hypothetical protein